MKSILMSIKPKWVEKIASGEKTVEVRKTVPKCGTPFKVYMYCTQDREYSLLQGANLPMHSKSRDYNNIQILACNQWWAKDHRDRINGKVVGEFVCDEVTEFESEFVDDDCYENIGLVTYDEDDGEREVHIFVDNEDIDKEDRALFKKSKLEWDELKKYIGIGIHTFYGLHISDLKIYDKPKELSEFRKPCAVEFNSEMCRCCDYYRYSLPCWGTVDLSSSWCADIERKLTRPPQSWCYVE